MHFFSISAHRAILKVRSAPLKVAQFYFLSAAAPHRRGTIVPKAASGGSRVVAFLRFSRFGKALPPSAGPLGRPRSSKTSGGLRAAIIFSWLGLLFKSLLKSLSLRCKAAVIPLQSSCDSAAEQLYFCQRHLCPCPHCAPHRRGRAATAAAGCASRRSPFAAFAPLVTLRCCGGRAPERSCLGGVAAPSGVARAGCAVALFFRVTAQAAPYRGNLGGVQKSRPYAALKAATDTKRNSAPRKSPQRPKPFIKKAVGFVRWAAVVNCLASRASCQPSARSFRAAGGQALRPKKGQAAPRVT